jgi:hypothetical protein
VVVTEVKEESKPAVQSGGGNGPDISKFKTAFAKKDYAGTINEIQVIKDSDNFANLSEGDKQLLESYRATSYAWLGEGAKNAGRHNEVVSHYNEALRSLNKLPADAKIEPSDKTVAQRRTITQGNLNASLQNSGKSR